ncbi:hypothetical protein [Microbacterium sp.]|uniref:hypothetical protein n=1 Tax=Microbacterium sp. TaxID=51671 RepID=UPI002E36541D|nr:hypothetical protein [Microbacterium sp.]HEX5728603.1 hypothetical protein [Microbacterium sp.]
MSTHTRSAKAPTPELIWVGDGAWIACDTSMPDTDPHRVIAYLECRNSRVSVLWVRDRQEAGLYETLREALDEVTARADRSAVHAGPAV